MFKKIFSGIILSLISFMLFNDNVFGKTHEQITKTLVCVVGNDYSKLLEYEGYEVINGGVNFNSEGNYYITYLNKETKETLTKKVSVISKDRVLEKPYFEINEKTILSNSNDVIDVVEHNECYYFLEQERVSETNIDIILTKVKNNVIEYSKKVKTNFDGGANNIHIDDSGIYITGVVYSSLYSYDLYICRVSFDGVLENENIIIGDNIDLINGTILSGDYLYLYGNTKSTNGIYQGKREKEDSVIVKVNKNLLQVENININTYPYINIFTNGVIFEDKIYLIEQYVSTEITQSVKYKTHVYDQNLNLVNTYDIYNSFFLTPLNLIVSNNRLMFLTYQYNPIIEKYSSCVFEIDREGKTQLFYEYVEYSKENVRLVDIYINDDNKVLLLFKDIITNGAMLVSINDRKILFTLKVENTSYPMKLQNNSLGYISFDKRTIDISYIMLKDNQVIINNGLIKKSDKSKINQDFSIFGNYINEYIYETKDICFCYHENIYIESDVSIADGEVYDKNLRLEFNGLGKLNDINILSGYVIEEEGDYVLDLVGKDNIHKVYKFKVRDLSSTAFHKKENNKLVKVDVNGEVDTELIKFNVDNNVEKKVSKSYYGFLLVPCVLILIMIILLARKKHEK